MEIKLGKYVITSDKYQFILNEIKTIKEGENAGKETMVTISYHPRMEMLIKKLLTLEVKSDDIKSLQDMNEKINQLSITLSSQISELIK
ncbi:hypothetical protein GKR59_15645 [Providencia alcalifaciens]|uniref:DUF5405 family protein n=1 Tax=Providencia TaxID=586 RepID=UPI0012B5F10F|nr:MULTISPECIES: DUF5405 family protein [Providencia]MTC51057.1 hypothetical protein [Providencia alcalifaciens]